MDTHQKTILYSIMKLTARDIEKINADVHDIIHDWLSLITVYNIKPVEQQANWKDAMHESSAPQYDIIEDVPCTLFDTSYVDENMTLGGYADTGKCRISVPYHFMKDGIKISCSTLFKYESMVKFKDDDTSMWNVTQIKRTQGEIYVTLEKVV